MESPPTFELLPLSFLDGCEITRFVGVEMALSWLEPNDECSGPTNIVWVSAAIPFLQLSSLDIHVSDGRIARLVAQLDDGTEHYGFYLLSVDEVRASEESPRGESLFHSREITELPRGVASIESVRREHPNAVVEFALRIGSDTIRFVAGEVYQQPDQSLRICEPDESILVQLNGSRPPRPRSELFHRDAGRSYRSFVVDGGAPLENLFDGRPYACLVWDHSAHASTTPSMEVSRAIIASNCRYVVCGGRGSREWENTVDEVFVTTLGTSTEDDLRAHHVMTTSHEGESVDDVAFFFVHNTNLAEHDFTEFLVLHVGGTEAQRRAILDAVRRTAAQFDS